MPVNRRIQHIKSFPSSVPVPIALIPLPPSLCLHPFTSICIPLPPPNPPLTPLPFPPSHPIPSGSHPLPSFVPCSNPLPPHPHKFFIIPSPFFLLPHPLKPNQGMGSPFQDWTN
ncbi:hypothetical protein PTTG_05272 [Puccinia triticina 1-1 BBBD Race 1]|uniref:Uncharacterized protein n=1 Tax=Puccinia triticina (isolate 1-1 / race 1 (BBBD)) TaxID=630390 RepID=A0A0C4EWS7_PUCT1|nr:hypothetical protein PTTG_05272 [Puccinia triticina 1-1 BBBD Race 1]